MSQLILIQTLFGLTTLIVGLFFGYRWINYLRTKKMGQNILELAPETHLVKQGTPTMGAAIIIVPALLTMSMYCFFYANTVNFQLIFILIFTMLGYAAIGLVDDWKKISKAQNEGLTPIQKLVLQFLVASLAFFMLDRIEMLSYSINFLLFGITVPVNEFFYFIIIVVLMVWYSNATNITDGVDGLLGTNAFIIFGFYFLITSGMSIFFDVNMFILALMCGILAFLYYNKYPAKVFMGDTGSLMMGPIMLILALITNTLIPFMIISLIFTFEAGSVFLQVSWFKYTKKKYGEGKRIFPMTPIHHSFEKAGWTENKVVLYFSLFTLALCIFTFIGISI